MHKYRRAFGWIALILTLALLIPLAGCGGGAAIASTPTGTISSPIGEVLVQKQGSDIWMTAVSGMKVNAGDRLKTGGNGTVDIIFFEGSTMEVGVNSEILVSELTIASQTGSTSIRLRQIVGHTVNRVQKLVDTASNYEIETPAGSAVVRGTSFKAYVGDTGYTVIACEQGSVWFTAGGVTVEVGEGKQAWAMPGGVPTIGTSFHTENVRICSDVRGDRDYTVRAEATFDPGDKVWIYFEAFSLTWKYSGGTYEVWYRVTDVKVYDPDGELYISGTSPVDFHQTQLEKVPNYLWGAVYVDLLPGVTAGQYKAELAFEDMLSNQTDSITVYFNVRGNQLR